MNGQNSNKGSLGHTKYDADVADSHLVDVAVVHDPLQAFHHHLQKIFIVDRQTPNKRLESILESVLIIWTN